MQKDFNQQNQEIINLQQNELNNQQNQEIITLQGFVKQQNELNNQNQEMYKLHEQKNKINTENSKIDKRSRSRKLWMQKNLEFKNLLDLP